MSSTQFSANVNVDAEERIRWIVSDCQRSNRLATVTKLHIFARFQANVHILKFRREKVCIAFHTSAEKNEKPPQVTPLRHTLRTKDYKQQTAIPQNRLRSFDNTFLLDLFRTIVQKDFCTLFWHQDSSRFSSCIMKNLSNRIHSSREGIFCHTVGKFWVNSNIKRPILNEVCSCDRRKKHMLFAATISQLITVSSNQEKWKSVFIFCPATSLCLWRIWTTEVQGTTSDLLRYWCAPVSLELMLLLLLRYGSVRVQRPGILMTLHKAVRSTFSLTLTRQPIVFRSRVWIIIADCIAVVSDCRLRVSPAIGEFTEKKNS